MVTFLAAIAFICFGTRDLFQRIILATVWLFIAVLITWTIYTGWEASHPTRIRILVDFWKKKLASISNHLTFVGYPSRDGKQPDFRNDLLEGETENGDAKIVPKLRWMGSIGRISLP